MYVGARRRQKFQCEKAWLFPPVEPRECEFRPLTFRICGIAGTDVASGLELVAFHAHSDHARGARVHRKVHMAATSIYGHNSSKD